ncbi:MAG: hypothetical protein O2816_15295, partial [Planctomycetota bacterium]|nr:hypothetical protein [Planctomycetota bacterium]
TGAFLDVFVQPGDGGLEDPHEMAFGPDGDLYVTSFGNGRVKRYDGTTGAFLDNFVKLSGGLQSPHAIDFRPDGMIYVASFAGGGAGHVRRFDANGDFVDEFVATGSGGLAGAISITFRPEDTLTLATPAGGSAVAWGAEPGEVVHFVLGDGVHARRVADCPFPLWVDRPVLLGSAVADGQGVATLPMVPPPGASGLTLSLQAVTLGSCRTSATAKVVLP